MKDLFGDDSYIVQKDKIDFNDYEAFVEKFKLKKTTDDCYTPPEIYAAILEYVKSKCDLTGKRVLRPFVPGGDYQTIAYKADDVVVDNPPFSILSKIITYYLEHNIKFFLFAPTLTLLSATKLRCTSIVCGAPIIYENGAVVNTSFATNLYGERALIVDGELHKLLSSVIEKKRKKTIKPVKAKVWGDYVISSALLRKIATRGISLTIPSESMSFVSTLDCGMRIFGGGALISEKAAAEKAAAEKAASEKAAAEKAAAEKAALSDRELKIIKSLL